MNLSTLELDRLEYGAQAYLSRRELHDLGPLEVKALVDHHLDYLVITLRTCIFGQKLEDIDVSYPSDWWEAVKERWAPACFTDRYPVQRNHHSLKAYALAEKVRVPKDYGSGTIKLSQYSWSDKDLG